MAMEEIRMARMSKEEQARREGMAYALRFAREKGLDALEADTSWKLYKIIPSRQSSRKRSMNELLFCMLRSKHRN